MSSSRNTPFDEEESRIFPSDDTSSIGGSSTITVTESLAESWFTDRHGRKVQAINQSYRFPSDETQRTAEDYASYWKLEKFGLYPKEVASSVEDLLLKPGSRVLDVGQGMSGLWLISMAERFSLSECTTGIDSQPLASDTIPSNMTTELFDVPVGLPYPDEFFDVINHSHLSQSFCSTFTYENLCSEIARCLKPRGVYFFFEAFRMRLCFLLLDEITVADTGRLFLTFQYSLFAENGDPMDKNFPAANRFRLALSKECAISSQPVYSVWSLSQVPDDTHFFTSVLRATDAFDPYDVTAESTQMGGRGVDPEADRIGEIFRNYSKKMCSPYFFLDAGYSEEEAKMWTSTLENEAEKMRSCTVGRARASSRDIRWGGR